MDFKHLRTIDCKQGAVRKVRFNVDGVYCISSGSDRTVKLWNPHKNLFLKTYSGHGNEVLDACGSADSSYILSGGADKSVIHWEVETGKPLRRLRVHVSNVTCVKYNEESTLAFSGSRDNTVMIWDLKSFNFQPIQVLKDAKDSITSIQITESEIITGSLDCKVRRYDIRSGCLTTDYIGEPVISVNITQDGQCYVVGSANKIWLFDKSTGELLNEYTGHETGDYQVECGVDRKDRHVISGAVDGNIYCWDLIGGSIVSKLNHKKATTVHSFDSHPTSDFLVTAIKENIWLWGEEEMEDEPEEEEDN
ncbi:unnamed protein product [Nezara viridula]|uniref:WD repeat domain-containing protein 83 n=1 Tax=Nezara viridula TaxID=85310 RepID=A0A9P0MUI4_NEZVI|nr:unnamed protein product [Nezara viridula]